MILLKCTELCKLTDPAHLNISDRAVSVLGNDDLGGICVVCRFGGGLCSAYILIIFISVQEENDIRKQLFFMLAKNSWPILALEFPGANLEDVFISVVDDNEKLENVKNEKKGGNKK